MATKDKIFWMRAEPILARAIDKDVEVLQRPPGEILRDIVRNYYLLVPGYATNSDSGNGDQDGTHN